MENYNEQLQNLRKEIDQIDDSLHEQIIKRANIVLEIAKLKKKLAETTGQAMTWHPAREITIIRRLIAKNNEAFPKTSIFRIWREMFGALINLQEPFSVGVFMPQRGAGFLEIARDQFGAYSPCTVYNSIGQVIRDVSEHIVSVGIIPIFDEQESPSPWWIKMLSAQDKKLKVVARLPLIGPGEGRGGGKEAYVIATIPNEQTGDDLSLIVIEVLEINLSTSALKEKLKKTGIQIEKIYASYMIDDKQCAYLADVKGYLAEDDPRIKKLCSEKKKNIAKITVIGGYAVPLKL